MIEKFQGETRWLSNFAPVKIVLDGIEYPSTEHAYMSAKCDDPAWKEFCSTTEKPGDVKRASYKVKLIEGWDDKRLAVMKEVNRQKYSQNPYKRMLIATGNEHLQEGNTWGDKFWGVDLKTGEGENNLGKIIMEIRSEL